MQRKEFSKILAGAGLAGLATLLPRQSEAHHENPRITYAKIPASEIPRVRRELTPFDATRIVYREAVEPFMKQVTSNLSNGSYVHWRIFTQFSQVPMADKYQGLVVGLMFHDEPIKSAHSKPVADNKWAIPYYALGGKVPDYCTMTGCVLMLTGIDLMKGKDHVIITCKEVLDRFEKALISVTTGGLPVKGLGRSIGCGFEDYILEAV